MKLGLFGSIHSTEDMKQFGLDDNMVMELFDRFKPDVICGEVRRDDYEQNREYQGPSEYRRFIFQYCKERGIRFVPCDQFEDSDVEYVQRMEKIEITGEDEEEIQSRATQIEKEAQRIMEEYMKAGAASPLPFNSDEFNAAVEEKQAFQERLHPYEQEIVWNNRNNNIVKNIKRVIEENPNANVLAVFGAEHIYWLKKAFSADENIEIVFPLC